MIIHMIIQKISDIEDDFIITVLPIGEKDMDGEIITDHSG